MGVASGLRMAWNHGVNIPELYMYSRNCNDADRPFPQNLNAAHSDYSSHPQNHHLLSSTPSLWQRFGDSGHSPTAANRKCSISLCLEPLPPSLFLFVRHTLDLHVVLAGGGSVARKRDKTAPGLFYQISTPGKSFFPQLDPCLLTLKIHKWQDSSLKWQREAVEMAKYPLLCASMCNFDYKHGGRALFPRILTIHFLHMRHYNFCCIGGW